MSKQTFDPITATVADINKLIASIKQRGATIQNDIQAAGVASLYQVATHGNTTPLNTLYLALPEGARKTGFALWAMKFGGVKLNTGKTKKTAPFILADKAETDVQGAVGTPWYKVQSERSLDSLVDVQKSVDQLLKRLAKAAQEGRVPADQKALLDHLTAAVGSYHREDVQPAVPGGVLARAQTLALPAQVH